MTAAQDLREPRGGPTLRPRGPDDLVVAGYFFAWPLLLAGARLGGVDPLDVGTGWRAVIVYGLAAPFVGVLVLLAARRARFAAYVFLTMEILRSALSERYLALGLAAAVLLYLQTPRMRARYPKLNAREMLRRPPRRPG